MKRLLVIVFFWVAHFTSGQVLIKPAIHDFGHFPEQREKVETYFTLENISDEKVDIINLHPSCGCAAAIVDTVTLLPNQSTRLLVIYDAKERPGDFFKTIKISFKNSVKIWHTHIAIKGYVIPEIANNNNEKTFIDKITIDTFDFHFRHELDTSYFESLDFKDLMNGLTYVMDQDGAVLLNFNVQAFNYKRNTAYLIGKLKKRIRNEMKKRGYPEDYVLFQAPSYEDVNNDDFLNAGNIQLTVVGYSGFTGNVYMIEKLINNDAKLDNKSYLNLINDTLSNLNPEFFEGEIYKAVNTIHQDLILGKLKNVQVVLTTNQNSKNTKKFLENWQDALLAEIENTMPESIVIPVIDPKVVLMQSANNYKVRIVNVVEKSITDTIVFEEKNSNLNSNTSTSIPVFNLKTKNPGEGDLELYQKKRLFANLKAQKNNPDTLEIVAVMQHNGFLKEVDNKDVLDAIVHYKIVLESIQREAERQGFRVKTKFWIQPFHVTHWNREEQAYLSIQFLSQFKSDKMFDFEEDDFVGFYNSKLNDSVIVAGSQSYYFDKMARAISKNGWLAIELYAYKYVDDELAEMKEVQKELIELTKKTLDEVKKELLQRGVDPNRLLITKEKIIVRNKPLDTVKGYGVHQPKNTVNDRFTKVVFKKELD